MFSDYFIMVMSCQQQGTWTIMLLVIIFHIYKYLLRIFPVWKGIISVRTKQLKQPIKPFHYILAMGHFGPHEPIISMCFPNYCIFYSGYAL